MGTTNFIRGNVQDISNDYVAVGTTDGLILHGRGMGLNKGQEVDVAVRPENVEFLGQHQDSMPHGDLNIFDARVDRATYVGELIDYQLTLGDSLIRAKGDVRRKRAVGESVEIYIDPDQLPVLRE
jgi:ABC-type Fe3+/spermidine/putrescine transport system ATPase subunit